MTWNMARIALLALAATLLLASPAAAQKCVAPPGTAGVDQYCETVPSAGGDTGSDAGAQRPAPVSARTVRTLGASGQDGRSLNRFLGHDEAREGKRRGSAGAADQQPVTRGSTDEPSSNPLGAVRLGDLIRRHRGQRVHLVLLILTVLVVGAAWMRYRRGPST